MSNYDTGSRAYMQSIFNGQTPVERQTVLPGQSKYYYYKPGQSDDIAVSDMKTVDVPTADTPNPFWEKYVDELAQLNPGYRMGQAVGTLRAAQQEMKRVKKDGYDNYAHRLGMCLNAQQGADMALYSLGGGILKEAKDIFCKTTGFCDKQVPFNEAWNDSVKDMHNNIEGIKYGLQNPDKSCKMWLNNLDYGSNIWKR